MRVNGGAKLFTSYQPGEQEKEGEKARAERRETDRETQR